MKKIITLFLLFISISAHAGDSLEKCVNNIYQDQESWHDKINAIFSNDTELTQDMITKQQTKLYNLLAQNILTSCSADLFEIIDTEQRHTIHFEYNGDLYALKFTPSELKKYIGIETGILVVNNLALSPGDIFQKSQITKKNKFFSDACSTHLVTGPLFNKDAAVNKAGQSAFGDNDNYFFLDFADGDDMRAFPGLVLMDMVNSTKEKLVTFPTLAEGKKETEDFFKKLQDQKSCNNQGLAVYTVALKVAPDTTTDKAAWVSAGAGVAAVAGTAAATGVTIGVISGPVGWLVLGAAGLGAAVYGLYPEELRQIDSVMILSGPYIL